MFRIEFKKPNIVWAFLFLAMPLVSRASFFEEQVQPVQERAFDKPAQKILLGGLASTWLAASQDSEARSQYRDHQTIPGQTSRLGDEFGTYLIGPMIALGQLYFDPENGQAHARALIYSTVVSSVLKETIRRQRPDGSNHQSMPSGHSTSAFATATSLTYAYGLKAAVVAYPVATFVAVSRMADDKHWLSDTVAGAFIGVWMGRATFYSVHSEHRSLMENFAPIVSSEKVGLSWQMDF